MGATTPKQMGLTFLSKVFQASSPLEAIPRLLTSGIWNVVLNRFSHV